MGINDDRFGGIARLYGQRGLSALQRASVMIVGIGGVGSWVAESLARSGIGALTLVDLDDVCVTNTNRQVHAQTQTVGRPKVDAMAQRIASFAPDCRVTPVHDFLTATSAATLLDGGVYDQVVDCIDSADNKCWLIRGCRERTLPLVTCGGAGGRRDPTRVQTADLARVSGDRLLKRVRKTLRQKHGFPRKGRFDVPTVFSDEPQRFPIADGGVCSSREEAASLALDCASGFGTASFLTGVFGLVASALVVGSVVAADEARA